MKVVLVFIGGPSNGSREEVEVNSPEPFDHRIKSKVDGKTRPKICQVSIAVYQLEQVNESCEPPEWIYRYLRTMTQEEHRGWWSAKDGVRKLPFFDMINRCVNLGEPPQPPRSSRPAPVPAVGSRGSCRRRWA